MYVSFKKCCVWWLSSFLVLSKLGFFLITPIGSAKFEKGFVILFLVQVFFIDGNTVIFTPEDSACLWFYGVEYFQMDISTIYFVDFGSKSEFFSVWTVNSRSCIAPGIFGHCNGCLLRFIDCKKCTIHWLQELYDLLLSKKFESGGPVHHFYNYFMN